MRVVDIIAKKKAGAALTEQEIRFVVTGFTQGEIPDYQMSALLMAICFCGMNRDEIFYLTDAMARSGRMADLRAVGGITVDKHSTGGVGDKTTLIAGPIAAACGVKIVKMSGRGLGFTGGTIDKLQAIPGFSTDLPEHTVLENVQKTNICVVSQSGDLVPADKKIYALRDVTATVDSIPLIAASIMSKKIASGCSCILLDVKTGSGAFMKTPQEALELARTMVELGRHAHRPTMALITNMDRPLGCAVGNALEVQEAVNTLRGAGPEDLLTLCVELAANMMVLACMGELKDCRAQAEAAVSSGSALAVFRQMIALQGGDARIADDPSLLGTAAHSCELLAPQDGFVSRIDTALCGTAAMMTGAGRETKEAGIDYQAGLLLHKKPGEPVKQGECVATLYANDQAKLAAAKEALCSAYLYTSKPAHSQPLLYARVSDAGTEWLHEE